MSNGEFILFTAEDGKTAVSTKFLTSDNLYNGI